MDRVIMVHHLDAWGFSNEIILRFAFLNSYFKTELKGPIDDAILAYAYINGYRFQASSWRKIDEIPFDFTRRRMTVIVETSLSTKDDENSHRADIIRYVITKGALEETLNLCTSIKHVESDAKVALTSEDRWRILRMNEELSNDGLRVLGVAMRRISKVLYDISFYLNY